ncbi:unnamed protein product [Ceutorhynchus assimilis]|uniref:Major facilitator superfamily (MFS) profile domain-containing protein n=1 Tax=Ceutorhynchus assimilis TaxID=467358 RepID=A0A9N9MXZ5_9CUCU|nr:unnamed protein product [Ceutorhynchus assimilis]
MSEPSKVKLGIKYEGNKGPRFGTRHLQILLISLGMSLNLCTKSILSVAIVAMTSNATSSNHDTPTYTWTNKSVIMSSLLWSGIAVNVLAGFLGNRYGPKWFLIGASSLNSLFFMLIPYSAAHSGSTGVIICRLLQGLAIGFLFPINAVAMGRWTPPEERARMEMTGPGILTIFQILTSIASGFISESKLGWPWIFYSLGIIELIWVVIYTIFGAQSFEEHNRIDLDEKKYLRDTLFATKDGNKGAPWKKIVSSVHVWAFTIGHTGFMFISVMLSTEISIFFNAVMKFDLKTNGTVSAIPPLIGISTGVAISILSDLITSKGFISVLNARRLFHLTGTTGVSLSLIAMTYISEDHKIWSVVLLSLGHAFFLSAAVAGAKINILDVSPKYAGIIMGFTQMFAQTISLFAPLLVQWICVDESDPSQWRKVFLILAALVGATAVFFALFATDQRQNWETESEIEARKKRGSLTSMSIGIKY